MTHPSMFKYLNVEASEFYFIHMLDTSKFIIYNTQAVHYRLMFNWIKCALNEECIAPPGSKFNGCYLDRRPQFLYSGCHRYEMSAFSILVARMFEMDEGSYTLGFNFTDEIRLGGTDSFIHKYETLGYEEKTTGTLKSSIML